jgi:hypothetical protein
MSSPSRTQVDAAFQKLVGDDRAGFHSDEAAADRERAAETTEFEREAPEPFLRVLVIPVREEPAEPRWRQLVPWLAVLVLVLEFVVFVLWRP